MLHAAGPPSHRSSPPRMLFAHERYVRPPGGCSPQCRYRRAQHDRVRAFYARVLGTGERPRWGGNLMNDLGLPIIGQEDRVTLDNLVIGLSQPAFGVSEGGSDAVGFPAGALVVDTAFDVGRDHVRVKRPNRETVLLSADGGEFSANGLVVGFELPCGQSTDGCLRDDRPRRPGRWKSVGTCARRSDRLPRRGDVRLQCFS